MADKLVTTNINTSTDPRQGLWGPYYIDVSKGVFVHSTFTSQPDPIMTRTTDKGIGWTPSLIFANHNMTQIACWFDQETPGDSGTLVHCIWMEQVSGDCFYISVDVADGTIGTLRTVATSTSGGFASDRCAITKLQNGRIIVAFRNTTDNHTFKSAETSAPYFAAAATSINDVYEGIASADADWCLLFPANVDDGDACALFWDRSTDQLSAKMWDDSAGTWTETTFGPTMVDDSQQIHMDGSIRHSDTRILFAAHSDHDDALDDLLTFEINPNSIGSPGIVSKAAVFTDQAESGQVAVHINQQNNDVRIAYLKGGTWDVAVNIATVLSTDGMTSWDAEIQMNEDAADDHRRVSAGRTTGTGGGRYQPGWFDDDQNDLFTSIVNDIEIAVAAAGAFPLVKDINLSTSLTNQTTHIIDLPANIDAGNLLIVCFSCDGDSGEISWPAGWTEFFRELNGTDVTLALAYRQADGGEGATIAVTTVNAQMTAHCSYRISGAEDPVIQPPEASTHEIGLTSNPNPPIRTPVGGPTDYLWLAVHGVDSLTSTSVYPTGYTNGITIAVNDLGGCGIAAAERELNAGSEDPGTFTVSAAEQWIATTVAIYPPVTALSQTKISALETLESLVQTRVGIIEALSSAVRVTNHGVEALARIPQVKTLLVESLVPLASTRVVSVESVARRAQIQAVQAEALGSVDVSAGGAIETVARIVHTTTIPVESKANVVVQTAVLPLEFLTELAVLNVSQIESLRLSTQTRIISVEALTLLGQTKGVPLESLALVAATIVTPAEAVSSLAATISATVEALAGVTQTEVAPIESIAELITQLAFLPIETLTELGATISTTLEALTILQASAPSSVESLIQAVQTKSLPLESMTRVTLVAVAPIESGANVVTQLVVVPLEALSLLSTIETLSFEGLRSLLQTNQGSLEALQVVAQTWGLSVETLVGLIVSGVFPLESLGVVLTPLNQTAILPIETGVSVLSQIIVLPYEVLSAAFRSGAILSNTVAYRTATTNPGVTDDAARDFRIGSFWINTTDNGVFICINHEVGAAVWVKIGPTV